MLDAHAGLAWVRDEVASLAAELQPALPLEDTPLCEFLRDGRALCLLTTALASSDATTQEPAALPKNLQRSLHQVTTFHALERVQFFIKWCRATAALDAHFVFSSVQLLDEQNDKVVCACLDALRTKYRPHLKSSGLWVQRSASNLLAAAAPGARDESDNQSSHDSDAPAAAAPVAVAPASNKLNAFLSKFPSETNVLAPVAVAPVAAAAVAAVAEQEAASDDSDADNNAEEPVETYEDTDGDIDDDDSAVPQPRAPHLGAFSPRSSLSRSSIGSSLSFSFTSDPRHHESFTDEQHQPMNLSFSSVLSSPPASPKPATRLRIPSIFERNTAEKTSESSSSSSAPTTTTTTTTTDLRSSASSTKDEATPRKLQIPSAFAAGASATGETPAPAAAADASAAAPEPSASKPVSKLNIPAAFARSSSTSTTSTTSDKTVVVAAKTEVPAVADTAAVVEPETSAPAPEPAAPKPVSKLSIPAAFSRSTSTSTSSSTSERASVAITTEASAVVATVVESEATESVPTESNVAASEPTTHKPVSKLSIPAAFSRSTSTSTSSNTSERLSLEKSETVAPSIEPASPSPASALTRKPSRLKIPSVFAAGASSSALDVSASAAKPVEPVVEVAVAAPIETVVTEEKSNTAEKEPVATTAAAAAVEAPTTPTAGTARAVPRSPFAAFVGSAVSTGPPSISRSTSSSSTTPASKLAAFLSTVEVASAFALPTTTTYEPEAEAEAKTASFSDDESDSDDDSVDANDDKNAQRVSVSQETASGLPTDAMAPSEEPSAVVVSDAQDEADVASRSSSEAHVSIDQFDERLSEGSAADAAEDNAEREAKSSDDSSDDEDDHVTPETVADAATTAVDEVEVEQHSIEHHDHADSEQPFFVVEEVSLSKPATSSKLYAFLHSVDSAQTHRFSHSSATDDALDAHVEAAHVERAVGSARSASTSSRHSSALESPAHKEPVDESTTSEQSDHSPRASVTSLKFVASADVILEKERLSGENLALQLKLQTATDALAAKDDAVAALQAELEALKAQLAAANAAAVAQAAAAESTLADRLAASDAAHREELAAVERSRDDALEAKTAADAQVAHLTREHAADASKLVALAEANDALTQELQRAKDSEEAARYSAQVAFAARDEAEERLRSQQ